MVSFSLLFSLSHLIYPHLLAEDTSRPSSPAPAPAAEAPSAPLPNARGNQKQRGGPAARGGKYYSRGGASNKSAPKDGNLNQNGVEEPVAPEGQRRRTSIILYLVRSSLPFFLADNRGRGRGRGRGSGTGSRGRPFDRHSQTGKTSVPPTQPLIPLLTNLLSDSDKKIHQSWGGDDGNTELKTEEAANVDAAVEGADANDWARDAHPAGEWGVPDSAPATADAWGAPDPASSAEAWAVPAADPTAPQPEGDKPEGRSRREKEPEEEDNTLTLEQYLAQQKEKESAIPKLEGTRKANEGADANIWKDVVPLQKEEEDAYFVGKVGVLILITLISFSYCPFLFADQERTENSCQERREGLFGNRGTVRSS